jgi:glycosyltransferase involved in cell wall biosynthesis
VSACIWYVSKYVALPSMGRAGTRGFSLMREMARLGHRCVVVTSDSNHLIQPPAFDGNLLVQTVDGVTVCWLRTRKYQGAHSFGRVLSWLHFEWALWRLPKRLLPQPDAVIISSLSLLTILNGLRLKWMRGCRLIFEIRDIWPLTIVEEGGFSRRNPLVWMLGVLERLGYRHSDAVVGTMPNLKAHVDESTSSAAPVHTIGFGVDARTLNEALPVPEEWVEKYIPEDKFIVCYAGAIGVSNALDTLFACARSMRDEPHIRFLIVGEGDLESHYRDQCRNLPNVIFAGAVPKAMVTSILERTDLVYFAAHPSKVWDYGLSLNKLVDYMLAGRPILGSYTGYRTMIEEAGAGSIVPAGDPEALEAEVRRYASLSGHERDAIGAHGRDWLLKHRTYERLASDYLRILLPDERAVSQEA